MSDMTNAVAIDLLDNLIGMVDDNQENDYDSALRMAIDALKAQADGDTISRQAAIDYCYALINAENPSDPSDEWNYSQERINQTEVILHHLEFMPSAQPELPEWAQKVEEYRKSAPSFVRNQLVWALYQTWKEYDGRLVHQRGKENRWLNVNHAEQILFG